MSLIDGHQRQPPPASGHPVRASSASTAVSAVLTVAQAAERLHTSPRFIRRLIFERRIPFLKLGRHVRIHSTDLDAYIAAGRIEPIQHH